MLALCWHPLVGGLKSPARAVFGNGDEEAERKGSQRMEERSDYSVQPVKRSTGKTSQLSLEQRLEILQQSIKDYIAAGGKVGLSKDIRNSRVYIILDDVRSEERDGGLWIVPA